MVLDSPSLMAFADQSIRSPNAYGRSRKLPIANVLVRISSAWLVLGAADMTLTSSRPVDSAGTCTQNASTSYPDQSAGYRRQTASGYMSGNHHLPEDVPDRDRSRS